jgi:hypothetical protein
MSAQVEETSSNRSTLGSKLMKLGIGLARLLYAWAAALYFIAWMELGWSGGIREMYEHVSTSPHVAPATTIAVLIGWFAGSPASKANDNWMYRHPLITQTIVAAALLGLVALSLF